MDGLKKTTGKYQGLYDSWSLLPSGQWGALRLPMTEGHMLPDVVLDVLREASAEPARRVFEKHLDMDARGCGRALPPLNRHRILIEGIALTWRQSEALVIAAFFRFDAALGQRVADVLADVDRVHVSTVQSGDCAGRCSPPGWKGLARAEIDMESDRTISDAVYLAHELGHLLAHDLAEEAGYDGLKGQTWMPKHAAEIPAFVGQHILYDYLMNGQGDQALQQAGRKHFIGEITRALYELQVAYALPADKNISPQEYAGHMKRALGDRWREFKKASDGRLCTSDLHGHISAAIIALGLCHGGKIVDRAVFQEIFCRGQDSHVSDMIYAAGIGSEDELRTFLAKAAASAAAPLENASECTRELETCPGARFQEGFGA